MGLLDFKLFFSILLAFESHITFHLLCKNINIANAVYQQYEN